LIPKINHKINQINQSINSKSTLELKLKDDALTLRLTRSFEDDASFQLPAASASSWLGSMITGSPQSTVKGIRKGSSCTSLKGIQMGSSALEDAAVGAVRSSSADHDTGVYGCGREATAAVEAAAGVYMEQDPDLNPSNASNASNPLSIL
jgi:hypothetical protein